MRLFVGVITAIAVLLLGFWAYQENYRTRAAVAEMRELQAEIGQLQEQLGVLRAEWAYLNRPERLRALAELNYERLRLLPMLPEHFGRVEQIAFPSSAPPADAAPLAPMAVSGAALP